MMASQSILEDLQDVAESLGRTALSCPVGAQRAAPSTHLTEEKTNSILQLHNTKQWLQHQLLQHQIALQAGKLHQKKKTFEIIVGTFEFESQHSS